jgi:hypothetical protein
VVAPEYEGREFLILFGGSALNRCFTAVDTIPFGWKSLLKLGSLVDITIQSVSEKERALQCPTSAMGLNRLSKSSRSPTVIWLGPVSSVPAARRSAENDRSWGELHPAGHLMQGLRPSFGVKAWLGHRPSLVLPLAKGGTGGIRQDAAVNSTARVVKVGTLSEMRSRSWGSSYTPRCRSSTPPLPCRLSRCHTGGARSESVHGRGR